MELVSFLVNCIMLARISRVVFPWPTPRHHFPNLGVERSVSLGAIRANQYGDMSDHTTLYIFMVRKAKLCQNNPSPHG